MILSTHQTLSNLNQNHCPECNSCRVKTRPYDELDTFHDAYPDIPRASLAIIDRYITEEGRNYASLKSAIERIVTKLNLKPATAPSNSSADPTSNGYTPMTILCNNCHSVFRFHRTDNSSHMPPTYCVFCGSPSLSTNQDPELDYLEVLAHAYKITPRVAAIMLDQFQHQNHFIHFDDYIQALRQQARSLVESK